MDMHIRPVRTVRKVRLISLMKISLFFSMSQPQISKEQVVFVE